MVELRLILLVIAAAIILSGQNPAGELVVRSDHERALRDESRLMSRVGVRDSSANRWWARDGIAAARKKGNSKGEKGDNGGNGDQSQGKVFTVALNGYAENGIYTTELSIADSTYRVALVSSTNMLIVPTDDCRSCGRMSKAYADKESLVPCAEDGSSAAISFQIKCGDGLTECSSDVCSFGACADGASNACCKGERCGWGLTLSDNSTMSGVLFQDLLSIADSTKVNAVVNGMDDQSGLVADGSLFRDFFDGIWGLAPEADNCGPTCSRPLLDELAESGAIDAPNFSVCLQEKGGIMTVGGVDPDHFTGDMEYATFDGENSNAYQFRVKSLEVGGSSVGLPGKNAIAEMSLSSPYHEMSPDFFTSLRETMQNMESACNVRFFCDAKGKPAVNDTLFQLDACAPSTTYPNGELQQLPTLTFQLDDASTVTMGPDNYLFQIYDTERQEYFTCLAFRPSEDLDGGPVDMVIGISFLIGRYAEFDRANGRLGTAPAKNCNGGCQENRRCEDCVVGESCGFCKDFGLCDIRSDLLHTMCGEVAETAKECADHSDVLDGQQVDGDYGDEWDEAAQEYGDDEGDSSAGGYDSDDYDAQGQDEYDSGGQEGSHSTLSAGILAGGLGIVVGICTVFFVAFLRNRRVVATSTTASQLQPVLEAEDPPVDDDDELSED